MHMGREGGAFTLYYSHSHAFLSFKSVLTQSNGAGLVSHPSDGSWGWLDLDEINLRQRLGLGVLSLDKIGS